MKKKILLIEDNIDMRENITEILQLEKYEVITADNGKTGVEKVKEINPDLIICDIMMPVLDGYSVLYALGKEPKFACIPFIFLTAKSEKADFRKGMEMGADDFLTKPFDDIDLLKAVETRLKKVDLLKEEFTKDAKGLNQFIQEVREIDQLKNLSSNQQIKIFQKNEIIYEQGKHPHFLYYIENGISKTFRVNEDGKKYITGIYKKGETLGHLALFNNSNYQESATAMEDLKVFMIPKDDFYNLLHHNYGISRKFISLLSSNIEGKEEQLIKLAYDSVRKRVADALILLYQCYKKHKGHAQQVLEISREDIANIAGTARESVIRTLSDFKREKLIDITPNGITILNKELLENMRN